MYVCSCNAQFLVDYSTPTGLERSDGCNVSQKQITIIGGLPLSLDDYDDTNLTDVAKLQIVAKNLRKRQRRPVRKTLTITHG